MNRGKLKIILDRPRHEQHVFIRPWEPKVIYSHTDPAQKGFAAKKLSLFSHAQSVFLWCSTGPQRTLAYCTATWSTILMYLSCILFTSFHYIAVHFFLLLLWLFSIKIWIKFTASSREGLLLSPSLTRPNWSLVLRVETPRLCLWYKQIWIHNW